MLLLFLDVEMVHLPLLPKNALHILILLISHGFKRALCIQAYHEIHCSSKEQRLDSILPPVIMWAAHVSKDAVNVSSSKPFLLLTLLKKWHSGWFVLNLNC